MLINGLKMSVFVGNKRETQMMDKRQDNPTVFLTLVNQNLVKQTHKRLSKTKTMNDKKRGRQKDPGKEKAWKRINCNCWLFKA